MRPGMNFFPSLHLRYHELWKLQYPGNPSLVRLFITHILAYVRAYSDELHRSLLVRVTPPSRHISHPALPGRSNIQRTFPSTWGKAKLTGRYRALRRF